METLFTRRFSWAFFLTSVVVLIGVYFLLKLILRVVQNISILGRYHNVVVRYLEHALLLIEPIALVILVAMFILIAPRMHAIIAGIVGIGTLSQIRNYFHGRAILFDQQIQPGVPIRTKEVSGRVTEIGRLGIRVKNSRGVSFVNYASLLNDGYALSSEEKIGGYYKLRVVKTDIDVSITREQLRAILTASPYLDSPPIIENQGEEQIVKISVRNKEHLSDLIDLLKDRDYEVSIK